MIIISLRFSGGSTDEEHDIAHIASSIVARVSGLFFAATSSQYSNLNGGLCLECRPCAP